MPDGAVYATENLLRQDVRPQPEDEPTIHGAVTQPRSYLENVSQTGDEVDFYDEATRRTRDVPVRRHRVRRDTSHRRGPLPARAEQERGHHPGSRAKLKGRRQRPSSCSGETTGTAAGGAAEEGKFLPVPGTNPFFPLPHDLQGNRFLELLAEHPLEVFLMNTGSVGGPVADERAGRCGSSTRLRSSRDRRGHDRVGGRSDFGYKVARHVPGIDAEDEAVLRPRELYEAQGRLDEYERQVERLHVSAASS